MTSRRRRDARRRRWSILVKRQLIFSMRNIDSTLPDGSIEPGAVFETWSMKRLYSRRPS